MTDVVNGFPQEIHKFQEEQQVLPKSLFCFFQLLGENYELNKETNITYIECTYFLKLSKYLEVRKLTHNIYEYINVHKVNADFVIQMIEYELEREK